MSAKIRRPQLVLPIRQRSIFRSKGKASHRRLPFSDPLNMFLYAGSKSYVSEYFSNFLAQGFNFLEPNLKQVQMCKLANQMVNSECLILFNKVISQTNTRLSTFYMKQIWVGLSCYEKVH